MSGLSTILGKNANIVKSGRPSRKKNHVTDLYNVGPLVLPFDHASRLLDVFLRAGSEYIDESHELSSNLVKMLEDDVPRNELGSSSKKSPRVIRNVRYVLLRVKQLLEEAKAGPKIDWTILDRHPAFKMVESPEQEMYGLLTNLEGYLRTYYNIFDYEAAHGTISRWREIRDRYAAFKPFIEGADDPRLLHTLTAVSGQVGERLRLHQEAGVELMWYQNPIDPSTFSKLP